MTFYDLCIDYEASSQVIITLQTLGFSTAAINYNHVGKINPNHPITNPIKKDKFSKHTGVQILSRITIRLEDCSLNYNMANSTKEFDILAIRPTDEKTLQHACTSMDCDIISLDLSLRMPFHLKHSTLGSATSRGVYLEICYSAGLHDTNSRRNLLSNAASVVRATRGRGIIISSEASSALGLRGPYDLVNLATFWGLSQERGRATLSENPRKVLVKAETRRSIHKGVLRITEQPEVTPYKRPAPAADGTTTEGKNPAKRKKNNAKQPVQTS